MFIKVKDTEDDEIYININRILWIMDNEIFIDGGYDIGVSDREYKYILSKLSEAGKIIGE